jgi:hypothetical protein
MSAGAFIRTTYEADSGEIHPIKVQPETVAANIGAANGAPGGAATSGISAKVSGGRREIGLLARKVRVAFTGAVPDGYEPGNTLSIPVLTSATYNAALPGTTGTYLGSPVVVVGRTPESVR